ncbi:hypothetical protein D3C71_2141850 [compost metagenome]
MALKRFAHLVGALEVAHATADGVARFQELKGDMATEEAGYAGEQNAIGHGCSPDELNDI